MGRVYCADGLKEVIDFLREEIFEQESYLRHGIQLQPGDVVFDAGAHIGVFALYAHQKCQGNLSLFCFEPIPQTYAFLLRNLTSRNLLDHEHVCIFNLGLTSSDGPRRAEFIHFENTSVLSTMKAEIAEGTFDLFRRSLNLKSLLQLTRLKYPRAFPLLWCLFIVSWPFHLPKLRRRLVRAEQSQGVGCELTTVSKIISQYDVPRIDLLKVDVEGAEWDVLQGVDSQDWPRIRQLVLEVHDIDNRAQRIE